MAEQTPNRSDAVKPSFLSISEDKIKQTLEYKLIQVWGQSLNRTQCVVDLSITVYFFWLAAWLLQTDSQIIFELRNSFVEQSWKDIVEQEIDAVYWGKSQTLAEIDCKWINLWDVLNYILVQELEEAGKIISREEKKWKLDEENDLWSGG